MFVGEFEREMDRDRRVALPPAFLEELRGRDERRGLVVLPAPAGSGPHLRLHRSGDVRDADLPRARFAELDSGGRVWLPEDAARQAGLGPRVVVLGNLDWIEVWDRARYEAGGDDLDPERALWARP